MPRDRLSREEGTIIKDWGGRLPVALIYPNSYYLGMSNLGIHTIYGLLNSYRNIVCERVFWEGKDSPLLSIESGRPLNDFAVLAFSISYELDYFNVTQVLKASGIPLFAAERDERHPLVIAGGPCLTANPAPLAPFFDAIGIGEAEAILPALLPALMDGISNRRDELLKALVSVPGIYIPGHSKTPVVRQWLKHLDDFSAASVVLTPDTELGDMYLIEVERGCGWSCRFCLVHHIFSPMRFRSPDRILTQAQQGLKYRRHIGLVGPAVTTHPQIEAIMAQLLEMGAELGVSSLRINSLSDRMLAQLAQGKMQTITLAPEAGSLRLRQVINKNMTDEEILSAIAKSAEHGIRQIKLYFMLGLPAETDEDVEGIIQLVSKARDLLERRHSGARLTLNIAPFVPKAGTPFQWLPMAPLDVLNHRLSRLKDTLLPRGITIKSESPAWSEIQAVLSRGDSSLTEVLADMEEFTLAGWRRATEKRQINADFYAHKKWDTKQKLPWDVVDLGTKAEKLEDSLSNMLAKQANNT